MGYGQSPALAKGEGEVNAIFIVLGALAVAVGGYRWYASFIDRKVMQADPRRVTPAKMYMDGVDFMPTSK